MTERRTGTWGVIGEWGSIAIAIISISFAVGTGYQVFRSQEPRLCKVETKCEDIAAMKTDIDWIKKGVSRIENKMDKQ